MSRFMARLRLTTDKRLRYASPKFASQTSFIRKTMVEVLEGSDWDNIETIQEKDGVYIYKFNMACHHTRHAMLFSD